MSRRRHTQPQTLCMTRVSRTGSLDVLLPGYKMLPYLLEMVDRGCLDCGVTDAVVLQWDHRDPRKKSAPLSKLVASRADNRAIRTEINKCDVRCANCHRIKTSIERSAHKHLIHLELASLSPTEQLAQLQEWLSPASSAIEQECPDCRRILPLEDFPSYQHGRLCYPCMLARRRDASRRARQAGGRITEPRFVDVSKELASCSRCRGVLSWQAFRIRSNGRLFSWCVSCEKSYAREQKHRFTASKRRSTIRNQRLAYAYLFLNGCIDCPTAGRTFTDPRALEFDHQGDKKQNIAHMLVQAWSVEAILEEIRKCQVRCANCHIYKTGRSVNSRRLLVQKNRDASTAWLPLSS